MRSSEEIQEVNRQELESACRDMKINKTPGIEGIANIFFKAVIESNTELFKQVFVTFIQERIFPTYLLNLLKRP